VRRYGGLLKGRLHRRTQNNPQARIEGAALDGLGAGAKRFGMPFALVLYAFIPFIPFIPVSFFFKSFLTGM